MRSHIFFGTNGVPQNDKEIELRSRCVMGGVAGKTCVAIGAATDAALSSGFFGHDAAAGAVA
jgi:hypothetical protein